MNTTQGQGTPDSPERVPRMVCAESLSAAKRYIEANMKHPDAISELAELAWMIEERVLAETTRLAEALKEAEANLEGARRVNARLTQVDFRNAALIDKLQEERDQLRKNNNP